MPKKQPTNYHPNGETQPLLSTSEEQSGSNEQSMRWAKEGGTGESKCTGRSNLPRYVEKSEFGCICKIISPTRRGTGFLCKIPVGPKDLFGLMTSTLVLNNYSQETLNTCGIFFGERVGTIKASDLANENGTHCLSPQENLCFVFLEIVPNLCDSLRAKGMYFIEGNEGNEFENVQMKMYPIRGQPINSSGQITSIKGYHIMIHCKMVLPEGCVGSPVINERGEAVGLNQGNVEKGVDNIKLATSFMKIKKFIQNQITMKLKPTLNDQATQSTGERNHLSSRQLACYNLEENSTYQTRQEQEFRQISTTDQPSRRREETEIQSGKSQEFEVRGNSVSKNCENQENDILPITEPQAPLSLKDLLETRVLEEISQNSQSSFYVEDSQVKSTENYIFSDGEQESPQEALGTSYPNQNATGSKNLKRSKDRKDEAKVDFLKEEEKIVSFGSAEVMKQGYLEIGSGALNLPEMEDQNGPEHACLPDNKENEIKSNHEKGNEVQNPQIILEQFEEPNQQVHFPQALDIQTPLSDGEINSQNDIAHSEIKESKSMFDNDYQGTLGENDGIGSKQDMQAEEHTKCQINLKESLISGIEINREIRTSQCDQAEVERNAQSGSVNVI